MKWKEFKFGGLVVFGTIIGSGILLILKRYELVGGILIAYFSFRCGWFLGEE